jgi:release factor glutamine methyltransferase
MTIKECLDKYQALARANNSDEQAIKYLIFEVSGYSAGEMFLRQNEQIDENILLAIDKKVNDFILKQIPIAHLLGYAYFYGRKFKVNEDVLIPRYETEELVEHVLFYYDAYFGKRTVKCLDLGTGSGAIAITLALEESNIIQTASDISESALKIAEDNAENLEANVNFIVSDWWQNITGKFDIVVANPPYLTKGEEIGVTVDKEPELALYGGDNGLKFYEAILKDANNYLNEYGLLAFEHGYQHHEALNKLIYQYFPHANVINKYDLQGKQRFTFIGLGGVLNDEVVK